jgi:hypothetical protein
MPKRNRIAIIALVAVVAIIAIVAFISLRPAEEPEKTVIPPPSSGSLAEFDHTQPGYTCSICHAPTPSHAAMQFDRCEDCHTYPTWDATHPDDPNCRTCHAIIVPAIHVVVAVECSTCHPKVGESWQFVHTGMETDCLQCHTVPADHYGTDCATCHDPSVPWAETAYPHSKVMDCAECHTPPHQEYPGVACYQCHQSAGITWKMTHWAFTSCVTCHEADRPAGHSLGDCVNCHRPPTWKPAAHPDATSSCIVCHKPPHRADYPVGCTSCHPLVGIAWKPTVHTKPMTCTLCHTSPADTAYTNHPDADCESCHDIPPFTWTDGSHPGSSADCGTCHTPPAGHPDLPCTTCHAVPPATWQDGTHPGTSATCTDCHTSPANTATTDHPDSDCGSCHPIPPGAWTDATHPASDSTCLTCHMPPHRTDYPVACAECHPQTGVAWLPVVHTTWATCTDCHSSPADTAYTNHPDIDCAACHAIAPATWQDGVHPADTATCTDCHTSPATTATTDHPDTTCGTCHPIPPSVWADATHPDASSTCLTCHTPPHRTDYPVPCTDCHPQVGVAWLPAVHTTNTNCAACHTPPPTDHTKRTDCASCHDPSRPWTEPIIP